MIPASTAPLTSLPALNKGLDKGLNNALDRGLELASGYFKGGFDIPLGDGLGDTSRGGQSGVYLEEGVRVVILRVVILKCFLRSAGMLLHGVIDRRPFIL